MLSMLLTVAVATVISGPEKPQSYDDALREARETGKPLMVVVSSDGCPACVALKNNTLAPMRAKGELQEVSYVVVNKDREPALAARLLRGRMIPQVVMYAKGMKGWKRMQLTGYQGESEIRSFVEKGLEVSKQGS